MNTALRKIIVFIILISCALELLIPYYLGYIFISYCTKIIIALLAAIGLSFITNIVIIIIVMLSLISGINYFVLYIVHIPELKLMLLHYIIKYKITFNTYNNCFLSCIKGYKKHIKEKKSE